MTTAAGLQTGSPGVLRFPYREDLLAVCARSVVRCGAEQLPDLSAFLVLLPAVHYKQVLLKKLLIAAREYGAQALIPPEITTLKLLATQRALGERRFLEPHERKFILAFSLKESSAFFKRGNLWQLGEELGVTFDEMAACGVAKRGEGGLVTTAPERVFLDLFHVWQAQSQDDELPDLHTLYLQYLESGVLGNGFGRIFMCGLDHLSPAEAGWSEKLLGEGSAVSFLHASPGDVCSPAAMHRVVPGLVAAADHGDGVSEFLHQAFDFGRTFFERATYCRRHFPQSPVAARLKIFWPGSMAQHAKGLCLRIQEWLAAGKQVVTVVSFDRKLARMLHASLANQGIKLLDSSGWALSTTSCATVVALLLPKESLGFCCDEILRLVRSPYCNFKRSQDSLARFVRAVRETIATVDYPLVTLKELLEVLEVKSRDSRCRTTREAGLFFQGVGQRLAGLEALFGRRVKSAEFFAALFSAFAAFGIRDVWRRDAAGREVLERLEEIRRFGSERDEEASWDFWRSWVLHTLEHNSFKPEVKVESGEAHVVLHNLQQAALLQSQALIVAALDLQHLSPLRGMLLNEQVRQDLDLPGKEVLRNLQQSRFRALLESAPEVLLSCQTYDRGGRVEAAPWLYSLRSFHEFCYQDDLADQPLFENSLPARAVFVAESLPHMPAPDAPAGSWPKTISAGAFQIASRCPYRFFVENCLGFREQNVAGSFLDKRDFGSHLHSCLAVLHSEMKDFAAGQDGGACSSGRERFLTLMREEVEREFLPYVRNSYANHFWLMAANDICASYVDWYLEHESFCTAEDVQSEVKLEKTFADGLCLQGRADLMVWLPSGQVVVDFKTGQVPARTRIEQGGEMQLFSYALMSENVHEVCYLKMQPYRALRTTALCGAELVGLQEKTLRRLEEFYGDFTCGEALPAWGSDEDCGHCPHGSLCRRQSWVAYEAS